MSTPAALSSLDSLVSHANVAAPIGSTRPDAAPPRRPAIDDLFHQMCEVGASDLHLSAAVHPLVRKDGEMRLLSEAADPIPGEALMRLLWEIMPPTNRTEFEARHDTDFAYEVAGLGRFRSNVFRDRQGIGGVFRLIPSNVLSAE